MKSHSKIKPIKSVLMKGAYLFGMKPKSIAKNFNVSLASVYIEPLERLRRYVELKYGKIVVQKKKIVEKKS